MAFRLKVRSLLPPLRHDSFSTLSPSSILTPGSTTPLLSHEKSRAAISLLRTETNPERVLDICRAASLTPHLHIDRQAFSRAIKSLKDSSYFDGIRKLLTHSISIPDNQTATNISYYILLYGQAGLLDNAIQTFDEMEKFGVKRNVKVLNSLLSACILAGDFGQMKRIFVEFPGKYKLMPNVETFNVVIKGFCESGQAISAYSIWAEMVRKDVRPNLETCTLMIAGFYKEEKFDDVGKVLEMMKKRKIKEGMPIYNARIKSLCRLKRMKEARALLDEVLSSGTNLKPNAITYGHFVPGYCMEGNLKEAIRNFDEMKTRGLVPEAECYFTLLYYLCEGKDFKAALDICKECLEKNWSPSVKIVKSLVDGLVSISEVDEARQIVGQLKEKFPTKADQWTEIEEGFPQ